MRPFLFDALLLLWATIAFLAVGIALCHRLWRLGGLELIGFGAAAGVVIMALLGIVVAATSWPKVIGLIATGLLPALALFYWIKRRLARELYQTLSPAMRWSLGLWMVFNLFCLFIVHLHVNPPHNLPDGLFVFKRPQLNVKIQYMVGLPADNYIPFVVSEYFVHGISFRKEHPIAPGQELSTRTILMSLAVLPFRAALGSWREEPVNLGTFRYVQQDWPDIARLNVGHRYEQFLVVGMLLNSFILLGLVLFGSALGTAASLFPLTLLAASNSYFITQTIFIWPKNLAGFFVLVSWYGLRRGLAPIAVGAIAALAYHSHPSAIGFAGGIALYYIVRSWRRQMPPVALALFFVGLVAAILPWICWSQFYLHLPSTGLFLQNFFGDQPVIDYLWARFKNLYELLTPTMFGIFPFDLSQVVKATSYSLPGAIGLLLFIPAFLELARWQRREPIFVWLAFILPGLALILVFSFPTITIVNLPATAAVLLALAVLWCERQLTRHFVQLIYFLQVLCNIGVWLMYRWLWHSHRL